MSEIKVGDLVLRDGKAEEVLDICPDGQWFINTRMGRGYNFRLSDATRIGSTREGWRIHTGSARPEGVGAEDRVEVFLADGRSLSPALADHWGWTSGMGLSRIVAYRIVQRATSPISGQGENCGAAERAPIFDYVNTGKPELRQPPASELKAVAAAIRKHAEGWGNLQGRAIAAGELRAWAERIDPPEPEPLKVGDRVRWGGLDWSIIALAEIAQWAVLGCEHDMGFVKDRSVLERIP